MVDSTFTNLPQVEQAVPGYSSLGQHQSVVARSAVSSNSANPISTDPTPRNCQATFYVSTSDILKLPQTGLPTVRKPSRSRKTAVLISSPYKNELITAQKIKEQGLKTT